MSKNLGPFMLFPLFGVPFVLVGLGMLLSPLWAYLSAQKTVYAVTDKRAVIMSGAFSRSVRSFGPNEIGDLVRVEDTSGRGSLFFAAKASYTRNGLMNLSRIGFVGIPNVRDVEQLVRGHLIQSAA